jgi:acetyl esterase/lipase
MASPDDLLHVNVLDLVAQHARPLPRRRMKIPVMQHIRNVIVALLLFAQIAASHAAEPVTPQLSGGAPNGKGVPIRIERDVTYLGPDRAEKADLYLPPTFEAGKKYPGIVIIHGGGWTGGDKAAAREINIGTTLASHGYVCMSINYALAKAGSPTFPRNIQDCKRAVRWLRKHADRFQLDKEHIGAIGGSAGGHLTALLAVSGSEVGLDPDEDDEYSCRIQAAVPMYPHCASSWEGQVPPKPYPTLPMFAEPQAVARDLWNSASPIKQLSKDDPPMLILHGTADKTTPLDQSTRFHQAAKDVGVQSELIIIEGAPHSFHLQPKQQDLRPAVIGFFDKNLKP